MEDLHSTPRYRRREVMGGVALTLGGLATAGCLGSSESGHQAVGDDAWDDTTEDESESSWSLEGALTLEPGEYAVRTFTVGTTVQLRHRIQTDGPEIDVWVLSDPALDAYREGDIPDMRRGVSKAGITDEEITGTLTSGKYNIVWDNSSSIGVAPDGPVVVQVELGYSAA